MSIRSICGAAGLLVATICGANAQNYERTPACERDFLRFDADAPNGYGAFAVSKDGGCAWVNGLSSDSAARLAALEKCERSTGFACKVSHVKDDRFAKQQEQQRQWEQRYRQQLCGYNPNAPGCR